MQTVIRQPAAPVRRLAATTRLRQGCLAALASLRLLLDACEATQDRVLKARAGKLRDTGAEHLRAHIQVAMGHPTLQTLKDSFDTVDEVLRVAEQIARRVRHHHETGLQVRIAVAMSGLRAGIADMEAGLEAIPLLPANASDYPEES